MDRLFMLGLLLTSLLFVSSSLAKFWWPFELATHFQIQYLVAFTILFIIFFLQKKYGSTGIALLFALVALSNVTPYLSLTHPVSAEDDASASLRVMFFNIKETNTNALKIVQTIKNENPDVLILAESYYLYPQITELLAEKYPYTKIITSPSLKSFDLSYFSKQDLQFKEHYLTSEKLPVIEFELIQEGEPLHIFGVHTRNPIGSYSFHGRNDELQELVAIIPRSSAIVMGDFNSTIWSPYLGDFAASANLHDARLGKGLLPSWNSVLPNPFRIPIDQAFTSHNLTVSSLHTASPSGSDHLPIIIDID